MAAAGFFHEDERLEVIGGEIVPMSPKGRKDEIVRGELALEIGRRTSRHIMVVAEAQFSLADDTYVKPDILVHPRSIRTPDVRGPTALLVIEIADTSLQYDIKKRAAIYAAHGVREYWVIDTRTMVTELVISLSEIALQ